MLPTDEVLLTRICIVKLLMKYVRPSVLENMKTDDYDKIQNDVVLVKIHKNASLAPGVVHVDQNSKFWLDSYLSLVRTKRLIN